MLDASAQHAGRTGREILTIAQRTMGLPGRRVAEMLELVSLTGTEADRRVGNYSLGMRQRLGIATALIGDPDVLILDEPANGLDPAGIRWMRDLLRGYADRGGTVLLSSHLLHEIEVIADDIVMIGNGRIVGQGSKASSCTAAGTVVRAPTSPPSGRPSTRPASTRRPLGRRCPAHRRRPRPGRAGRPGGRRGAHRTAPRRRRPRGDVPPAHRRHPTRKDSGMTAIATAPVRERRRRRPRRSPSPGSSGSSSARCSTPGRASGCWPASSSPACWPPSATIAFAPDDQLTYYTFAKAIGFPMTVILPIIAILAITGEWSQRTGLTTFTLVPHRSRVIAAKTISSVTWPSPRCCSPSCSARSATWSVRRSPAPQVWDVSVAEGVNIVLGNLLCLLTGTMLGMLIRSSAGALVVYFVYSLLLPTVSGSSRPPRSGSGTCSRGSTSTSPRRPSSRARSPESSGPTSPSPRRSGWSCLASLGLRLVMRSEMK